MTDDEEALKQLSQGVADVRAALGRIIVGQQEVIEQLLIAMLAGGHCILVGVPGLAKTLIISSLAKLIDLDFSRIQFTPDLMPADITGTEVIQQDQASGTREFRFIPGPIFANIVLADEVNRTPPKTQAALLEAMQEHQVTSGGDLHALPSPFFVLATQNPIEQEGTYPLPEAQLDRFMFNIKVEYPTQEEELAIVLQTTSERNDVPEKLISGQQLLELSSVVRRIAITSSLALVATQIARLSRPGLGRDSSEISELVDRCVRWGAGPRASQYIVLGAKARAALHGSPVVRREDIDAVAKPVLRHRIKLNFQAEAEGIQVEDVILRILRDVDRELERSNDTAQLSN